MFWMQNLREILRASLCTIGLTVLQLHVLMFALWPLADTMRDCNKSTNPDDFEHMSEFVVLLKVGNAL